VKRAMRSTRSGIAVIVLFSLFALSLLPVLGWAARDKAASSWAGVDEAVVERIAREHGREAAQPLINTNRGDLLLFAFLMAGAIGGFAGGYYWRKLTEQRAGDTKGA
jgi:hypothetical protein